MTSVKTKKQTPPLYRGISPWKHFFAFQRDRHAFLRKAYKEAGPVFTIQMGPKKIAIIVGPQNHKIFYELTDTKLRADLAYVYLRRMFGPLGFTAPPEEYHRQRPVLHASFSRKRMVGYVHIMQEEIRQWLDTLGDEGEFEINHDLTLVIQNVAAHCFMGVDFRNRMGEEFWHNYSILGRGIDPILPPGLPLPRFIRRDRAKARLQKMLRPLIQERRANPDKYDDFLQDFVNARYKDGEPMEDDIIIGLIMALMFAGHETTIGQASWTVLQLIQHPDYLQKVLNEIDQLFPYGEMLSITDLPKLQHTYWAVMETARTKPSADINMRVAVEDVEVGDYVIPAGWPVMVVAPVAHIVEEVFEEPFEYDPLRFAPPREEDRQRYSIIAWGGGVHKCTGMTFAINEMLLITAMLFQRYELEIVSPKEPKSVYGIGAIRPEQTIVRYRRREQPLGLHATRETSTEEGCPAPHNQDAAECPVPHSQD